MTTRPALADLATMSGGMPIGQQYIFTLDQLARLVRLAGGDLALIALHDRLEKSGVPVKLYVDNKH